MTAQFATERATYARQILNAASERLDSQLREITASYREQLIDADDVSVLVANALATYQRDVEHPLVMAGLAEPA